MLAPSAEQSRRKGCAEEGYSHSALGPGASHEAALNCRLGSRLAVLVAALELAMEMGRRQGGGCSDSARGEGLAWHWDRHHACDGKTPVLRSNKATCDRLFHCL